MNIKIDLIVGTIIWTGIALACLFIGVVLMKFINIFMLYIDAPITGWQLGAISVGIGLMASISIFISELKNKKLEED